MSETSVGGSPDHADDGGQCAGCGRCRHWAADGAAAAPRHMPGLEVLRGKTTCSIETAAGLLGIGRSTAYAAARDGSLPTVRLSHRLLVPTAKLMVMLGLEDER